MVSKIATSCLFPGKLFMGMWLPDRYAQFPCNFFLFSKHDFFFSSFKQRTQAYCRRAKKTRNIKHTHRKHLLCWYTKVSLTL